MIDQILLSDEPGVRALLLGNEAIVRGAIEAGVAVVSGYPGTPASEIGDTFWRIREKLGIRCEYAVNEKVALEVAAGAAQAGVRSLVSFKHLGLNVAADALPTLANAGVLAGMVIVTAGDPGNHTSPNEQDHRLLARMARLPMLDPATPEQARAMTALAFEISEELGIPVLLRPTTRVSHTRGAVTLGERRPIRTRGELIRDPSRFVPLPPNARRAMAGLGQKLERAEAILAGSPWTTLEGRGPLGIVSSGVAACYVREVIDDLDGLGEISHLQIPSGSPIPRDPCRELLGRCSQVIVVEELMPVIEEQLRSLALDLRPPPRLVDSAGSEPPRLVDPAGSKPPRLMDPPDPKPPRLVDPPDPKPPRLVDPPDPKPPRLMDPPRLIGKISGDLPVVGEYSPSLIRPVIARALGVDPAEIWPVSRPPEPRDLPVRPPVLCPGCPHRATFAAVRLIFPADEAVYVNDIGCYSLGFGEPLGCADFLLCMGSSITQASGMSTALEPRTTVAFIGDSTFLHSGITGLLNAVSCGHDLVVVIMDNGTTAMTGHQPHAGIAHERGWPGPSASIEDIVRGVGVDQLWLFNPHDVPAATRALSEVREAKGVRVVISRDPCPVDLRRLGRSPERPVYRIDHQRCRACATRASGLPCSLEPSRALSRVRVLRATSNPERGSHDVAPCTAACPLSVCVPGYTGLVAAGKLDEAATLVRERNPLPSVCSRVCHAPCEDGCVRAEDGEPLAINALKRVAVDGGRIRRPERPSQKSDTSVAIVGSGPAGLACADELAHLGHRVVIYEAAAEPGGMLRYGIPPYRLPREVLDRDIAGIAGDGVEIRCNTSLGHDLSLDELRRDHSAVFLGIGAWIGARLGVDGDDLDGVTDCLTFLGQGLSASPPSLAAKRVVVIGGGDAAIDCARVARRLDVEQVTILYRRGREQMPAEDGEIASALAEGVELVTWSRPVEVIGSEGRVTALACCRTEPGPAGADGRVTACDIADTRHEIPADLVIAAIGQQVDLSVFGETKPELTQRSTLATDPETCATSLEGVYAGGDAATGPRSVVEALAAGKRAARAISRRLGLGASVPGGHPSLEKGFSPEPPSLKTVREKISRSESAPRPPAGGGQGAVWDCQAEALRCLGCAPCAACDICTSLLGCPAIALGTDGKPEIDGSLCNGCGLCAAYCPAGAIVMEGRP